MAQLLTISGVDATAYLEYGSLSVKFNTCDFNLIDWPGTHNYLDAVFVKDPGWTGTVVASSVADMITPWSHHTRIHVTATNALAISSMPNTSPFGISDVPSQAAANHFTLEDGSGVLVLEDNTAWAPGDYQLENSGADTYGYRVASSETQVNTADLSTTSFARFTMFQPGLRPGMTVVVSSVNLGLAFIALYVIQVEVSWPVTAGPVFEITAVANTVASINSASYPTLNFWRITG